MPEEIGTTEMQKYRNRNKRLRLETSSNGWDAHWQDLSDYMMPRKGRYLKGNTEDGKIGEKKHQKIINGSANDALRIVAAGMQGGLTSPSRPWFLLVLDDEELMEFAPVKEWLHNVTKSMLSVYARSNFYGSIHGQYKELAGFGTGAMLIEEDLETIIRCRPFTIGEYRLSLDSKYRPNTLYRQFSMSAQQLVEKFGEENVSTPVKDAAKGSTSKDNRFEIIHCIEPLENRDRRGMSYRSVYLEVLVDGDDKFLRDGGYRTKPFVGPRWDVTGVDTYGNSPGMEALGDVKMLQSMETKKLKALAKKIDPPMVAATSLRSKGGTIIPGGINYVDVTAGTQGFIPAYQLDIDITDIEFGIDRVEGRIRRFFFNDLFLATLGTDKEMTATEVAERHEEKLIMLGPVIERLDAELLDVIIERTYSIMENLGMIPPPPPELAGRELQIKYISLLAQAQQAVGISSIRRLAEFVGGLVQFYPRITDKFDADEAVDQLASTMGVPPKVVVSDDKVAEKREADIKAEQELAAAQAATQVVESGKTLSETELDKGSALDAVLEGSET